jgi:transposase
LDPIHQKLEEAGIEVYLVNARHVPGRKIDVQDSQWLRQLHRFGLLNASFRPDDIICRLRSLHRHRDNLVSSSAPEIQHIQKALQEMNLHLHPTSCCQ